jgi:hypothetical protein
VQTKLWLLEIIELIGVRIISTKELNIEHGARIRNDLHHITKDLLDELLAVITRSKNFTHRSEVKTGIFGLFNKEEKENSMYDFVKIFPPTIFQHYERYKESVKKALEVRQLKEKSQVLEGDQKADLEHPRERLSSYLLELENTTENQGNPLDNFLFERFVNIPEPDFVEYLSLCCLKTLIRIGNSILVNVYEKDLARISLIVRTPLF